MDEPAQIPALPELFLEQYLLGELPEAQRERVEAWLATEDGARRLDALRASNHAILAKHPPAHVAAEVARTLRLAQTARAPRARPGAAPRIALAALSCALLVLAVWWWQSARNDRAPGDTQDLAQPADDGSRDALARVVPAAGEDAAGVRAKGLAPHLVIYRRDGAGGAQRLVPGTEVSARDLLQISYVAAARQHGVVLSIDGRGVVTLHHPEAGGGSTRLEPSGEVALGHAYELDDAPRFERFFLVTGAQPLEVDQIVQSARALAARDDAARAPLSLPDGLEQTSFMVHKAPPTDRDGAP